MTAGYGAQDKQIQGHIFLLVNGTIRLTGAVQITGENSTLFSECFVLMPTADGHCNIVHQIFKVHKPRSDDFALEPKTELPAC